MRGFLGADRLLSGRWGQSFTSSPGAAMRTFMSNRLATESSPYLLQHKDNPVDWYPWGEEAFARAKSEDKPVFLSIGYAACHWCHVMAHESFESEAIAALMNEHFVNVKVDREERPDVDAIYMNAIQVMGEGGGWPLSAFLTSEGKPYFLGTYFPPADKYGRPGFPRLLTAMAQVYREQRDKVVQNTEAIMEGLAQVDAHYRGGAGDAAAALEPGLLVTAGRQLAQKTDSTYGGFGGAPKFPSSSNHDFLARAGRLSFGEPAKAAFLLQAEKMAAGGIYDHVGGGFARYAVDQKWLVPHFEKMLYDNGQLLGIYGDAFAMTGNPDFARVIRETIVWLEREMVHESGGVYASQDADSEGEEGKYYVWSPDELRAVLGPVDAIFFAKTYGVTEAGNFEGKNVLERVSPRGSESDEAALADMRARLLEARSRRIPPETDTKVLSGWNGLLISGLVRAWEATGHEPALALATRVASFLAERMLHESGQRLWRVFKDGVTKLEGTLDDYAFCAAAFMDLAEASGDASWWQRATMLTQTVLSRFHQQVDGVSVFYMTPEEDDALLIHRPESHTDGAIPAGAAVIVECLVRLGHMSGDDHALEVAETYLAQRIPRAQQALFAAGRLLGSLDWYLHATEVVVTEGAGRQELLTAARRAYAPTMMLAGPWASEAILGGKAALDGRARAYVCRGQTCSAPVTEVDALVELLG